MMMTVRLGLVMLAAAIVAGGCDRREPAAQPSQAAEPADAAVVQAADLAPDFTLTDHHGQSHTLSDYRGQCVVLEWINPECPFVVRHHETKTTMADLAAAYADDGVVWLAINTTAHFDQAKNKAAVENWNIPFPVLNDNDGTVGRQYGATRTPEMVIIDPSGRIVYHGAIDDDPRGNKDQVVNYVQQALDALLAGQPVSVARTDPYGCTIKWAQ